MRPGFLPEASREISYSTSRELVPALVGQVRGTSVSIKVNTYEYIRSPDALKASASTFLRYGSNERVSPCYDMWHDTYWFRPQSYDRCCRGVRIFLPMKRIPQEQIRIWELVVPRGYKTDCIIRAKCTNRHQLKPSNDCRLLKMLLH